MRWNRYQRRVLAVGPGSAAPVVGRWVEGPGWRPLGVSPAYGPVDGRYVVTHRSFLAEQTIAGVWAAASGQLLRERP